MQLRRVVEVAGMLEHCDFTEQPTANTGGRTIRPDLIVHLAGDKNVVIDAKVPLIHYLEAAELADASAQQVRLRAHAKALRTHVDALAAKEYWTGFGSSPEFVVLFVPGEAFLAPALEQDPSLLEYAMEQRVVVATPTTLLTLLRTVAFGWQQAALTDNARQVFEVGQELYKRLGTLGGHVDKLGRSLRRSVDDYNATVGSLERNVLVQARKLATLKITDRKLDEPEALDATPRPLTAPELVEDAEIARDFRLVRGPASARGRPEPRDSAAEPGLDEDARENEAAAMP
jgi:DNA recombination protein RmuC